MNQVKWDFGNAIRWKIYYHSRKKIKKERKEDYYEWNHTQFLSFFSLNNVTKSLEK